MKFSQTGALAVVAVLLFGGGCSSTGKSKGQDGFGPGFKYPQIYPYKEGAGNAYPSGGKSLSGPNAEGPLAQRVVYFMYDSSEVQPQYIPVINSHADYLAANPNKTVVLQGHADERGSPEYNIALGEQRAKTVANMMKLQGVVDGQIQIVSFGEEKPEAPSHDESAWQRNRRVEITYPGQ